MSQHKDKLVAKIVKMSTEIVIPEAPVDAKGNIIDSSFRFHYYRQHYWDNVDLLDERLVNNPVFHNKLEYFFSKNMMMQHWDTVLYYAFDFCDQTALLVGDAVDGRVDVVQAHQLIDELARDESVTIGELHTDEGIELDELPHPVVQR